MQVSTYINDLLYRYECVIVPGFGAFLTQYHSAIIDEASHTFYPPGKTLLFNRQLQTNDGLLANYVASVENCSYELALQKIRNFTGKLSLQLAERQRISLNNIGEIYLNDEHSIQFIPSEKDTFSPVSFGLSIFTAPPISREVYQEATLEIEKKAPLLFTSEARESRPYLKYAAIGLIAISIMGLGGLKMYEGQVEKHNFVEKQKANTMLENQIQEATFVIENPLPILNLTLPKQSGNYHLVAGAFRVEQNADKKLQQLIEKGFAAKSIGVNKYGLHMIVYSSHENRLEAQKKLREIKNSENENAWLLVKELAK